MAWSHQAAFSASPASQASQDVTSITSTILQCTAPNPTMPYHAIPCHTMPYHAIPCHTQMCEFSPCSSWQHLCHRLCLNGDQPQPVSAQTYSKLVCQNKLIVMCHINVIFICHILASPKDCLKALWPLWLWYIHLDEFRWSQDRAWLISAQLPPSTSAA